MVGAFRRATSFVSRSRGPKAKLAFKPGPRNLCARPDPVLPVKLKTDAHDTPLGHEAPGNDDSPGQFGCIPMSAAFRVPGHWFASFVVAGCMAACVHSPSATDLELGLDEYFTSVEVDVQPVMIVRVSPDYPSQWRGSKRHVECMVTFIIAKSGAVTSAQVERSGRQGPNEEAFETAAVAAVRQWRFRPARKSGLPVPVIMRVPIEFVGR